MVKSVYSNNLPKSDKVREMLLASANYIEDAGLYPVQEIVLQTSPKISRKRRLDHLSTEEKIKRKKLKNREAAQTSRDRKKAYLTDLEEAVRLLQQENKLLSERVTLLEKENRKLRGSEKEAAPTGAQGPAASADPLQKGSAPEVPPSKRLQHGRLTTLLATVTALTCLTGSPTTSDSTTKPTTTSLQSSPTSSNPTFLHQTLLRKKIRKWWGPGGGKRAWKPPPPMQYG